MSNSTDDDEIFEQEETQQSRDIKLYETATIVVRNKAHELPKDALLYFYARFKFINDGPCNTPRPGGLFNFEAKSKWDKWKELGEKLTKEEAREQYVKKVDDLVPKWRDEYIDDSKISKANQKGTFGVRMSVMAKNDDSPSNSYSNESYFDLCKEGKLDLLKDLLLKNQTQHDVDLDQTDESGMTMLMWACDRGHLNMVKYLTESGADLNKQDTDGQTCLHFAVSCDYVDIVKYLIENKNIDVNRADNDGQKPIDISQNQEITHLLSTF